MVSPASRAASASACSSAGAASPYTVPACWTQSPIAWTYRKVVVRDDRLVGGVLVGELGTVGALARAWEGAEPLPSDGGPLLHLLTNDGGS